MGQVVKLGADGDAELGAVAITPVAGPGEVIACRFAPPEPFACGMRAAPSTQ